ncbi:DUF547 domain-containing protein [Patiriisocius hiemis]|uniref:DUF547 domain-containing protein n=1 Tax=Patiriisocius hiemis TaxID=3075604 RepID=A0ABU2YDM8_9FLAO|nr:DUF547 domain-containing protein [Constantimarinum sp. W242]MDT0556291.1 DUF547 domain-containing protein [Constantimarinum sp. W242]
MKKNIINSILLLSLIVLFESCALLTAAGLSSQGQPVKEVTPPLTSTTANSEVNVDHSDWDALLKKHVDEAGLVDYNGFKNDKAALNDYLNKLSQLTPTKKWSVQELLAYYINLYNAYTVDLIIDNYPVKSIKDIDGPWTKAIVPIGSKTLSLGGIENGVLRKMDEPRIHFAINCASISCPKLLREAFTAAKINEQLDKAAREFINSDKNDISQNNPKVSSIFDWYKKDYTVNGNQDVIGYINQYSDTKINKTATLSFKEYNWNLNEKE